MTADSIHNPYLANIRTSDRHRTVRHHCTRSPDQRDYRPNDSRSRYRTCSNPCARASDERRNRHCRKNRADLRINYTPSNQRSSDLDSSEVKCSQIHDSLSDVSCDNCSTPSNKCFRNLDEERTTRIEHLQNTSSNVLTSPDPMENLPIHNTWWERTNSVMDNRSSCDKTSNSTTDNLTSARAIRNTSCWCERTDSIMASNEETTHNTSCWRQRITLTSKIEPVQEPNSSNPKTVQNKIVSQANEEGFQLVNNCSSNEHSRNYDYFDLERKKINSSSNNCFSSPTNLSGCRLSSLDNGCQKFNDSNQEKINSSCKHPDCVSNLSIDDPQYDNSSSDPNKKDVKYTSLNSNVGSIRGNDNIPSRISGLSEDYDVPENSGSQCSKCNRCFDSYHVSGMLDRDQRSVAMRLRKDINDSCVSEWTNNTCATQSLRRKFRKQKQGWSFRVALSKCKYTFFLICTEKYYMLLYVTLDYV